MDRVPLTGFARGAAEYERARPGWPVEVAQAAFDHWDMAPAQTAVLDLGAGTGRLTRVLAELGADVVAVEPVGEMRGFIAHGTALDGTAERLPLPAASVDAVFVAEAFHWFDARAASVARLLAAHSVHEFEQRWRCDLYVTRLRTWEGPSGQTVAGRLWGL